LFTPPQEKKISPRRKVKQVYKNACKFNLKANESGKKKSKRQRLAEAFEEKFNAYT
jgi:hypothetical protein